jgi:curved DNA-binding protein CbpA
MSEQEFVDHYELLQLSPNADTDTIERMFRHHAKRSHPDTTEFADNDRFYKIVEAHRTLTDPEARAAYDAKYQDYWNRKWKLASEASDRSAFGDDQVTRERLLSLMYVQRRRNMDNPGLGEHEAARLLGIPLELAEFHTWYLRNKGWVERLDTGQLAITAPGVDQVEQSQLRLRSDRLIEAHDLARADSEERGGSPGEPLKIRDLTP